MTAPKTASIFLSIAVLLSLVHFAAPGNAPGGSANCAFGDIVEDVRGSINAMKEKIHGLATFVETVTGAVKTIVSLAGIRAVMLLLGVMLISSLAYHLGVPRGKLSFLLSLACADALWVLWHRSFGPLDAAFAFTVAKTTLTVLAPFIAISLIGRAWPSLARMGRRAFRKVFPGGGRDGAEVAEELQRYQSLHSGLESALLRDIIDAKGGRVHLSGDTRRLAAEMALLAGGLAEGKKDGE
ncbi:MAG: hypothetical protein KBA61_08060 [Spirochaetes bacterium]|nr:hypothetical protein [Spirochaetota bacterium]